MQNRRLVSVSGSPSALPDQFQSNTISLKIQCVNPSISTLPLGSPSYTVQNMGTYGMRVAAGAAPTGAAGGPTPVALQNAMVWDGVNQWFIGDLNLNTVGVDGLLGSAPLIQAYFEVNLTTNGTRITILQITFNLRAVLDELTGTVPTPTEQFLTAAESRALFMPRVGAPGDVLTLAAPTSGKKVEIGLDDQSELTTTIF